ncbi:hypothetical protein EKO27_g10595 [Xylaria grammica]|uniref:Uncharacterized protein n=1 Tax=Xylaria grammica TaxID=363999 RepID=A0A439CQY7_9PEZI|nr:hypothetical protein EKO27_g10595 [Xylaria grammica]
MHPDVAKLKLAPVVRFCASKEEEPCYEGVVVVVVGVVVQPHDDVTADAGCEVDFGLEVKFDANQERGALELAVVVDGALEEVACWSPPLVSRQLIGRSG